MLNQVNLDYNHIVNVKPANENESFHSIIMSVLVDVNRYLVHHPHIIHRKILVIFCKKQQHNYDIEGLIDQIIFYLVELITGLPVFDHLVELITFVSEDQHILIQPFLDKILRFKSRFIKY